MTGDGAIHLLIERAREEYETATQNLGIATTQRDRQIEKLQMLKDYRTEYRGRLQHSSAAGMGVAQLINFQRFLEQLDQAVEQQSAAAQRAEGTLGFVRNQWQEAHRRLRSYEILQTRKATAEQRVTARKEQRESDAHAQRIAQARKSPF